MGMAYIEAGERMQYSSFDQRLLSYSLHGGAFRRCRESLIQRLAQHAPVAPATERATEGNLRRVQELKAILQHSHPDKATGDTQTFLAAKRELAKLRQQTNG